MRTNRTRTVVVLALAATFSFVGLAAVSADKAGDSKAKKKPSSADVKALSVFQDFVGGWRGAGLPRRGSAEGAWQEDSDWTWEFDGGRAALSFESPDGKLYRAGRLAPAKKAGSYVFVGTLPDGKSTETFTGRADGEKLILEANKVKEDRPAQITMRTVAQGDRLLVLFSKKIGDNAYARIAQVGYTRKGSGFGSGNKANECVVTGGESSSTVSYKGKDYPVCCRGCRNLFMEDPEGVLAEYRLRKEKEEKEKQERDAG